MRGQLSVRTRHWLEIGGFASVLQTRNMDISVDTGKKIVTVHRHTHRNSPTWPHYKSDVA